MNEFNLDDAISNLDDDLVERHLKKKTIIRQHPVRRFIKTNLKTGIVAACVLISIICVSVFNIVRYDIPKTIPDEVYSFSLGENCEKNINGHYYSIAINNVYLTRKINGVLTNSGGYLVFSGNIDTEGFSFLTDKIELEIIFKKKTDNESTQIKFLKDLSKQASEVELLYEEQKGAMKGNFCLVFYVDESCYSSIESELTQISLESNPRTQIRLHSNIFWGGGKTVFDFQAIDVQLVEEVD